MQANKLTPLEVREVRAKLEHYMYLANFTDPEELMNLVASLTSVLNSKLTTDASISSSVPIYLRRSWIPGVENDSEDPTFHVGAVNRTAQYPFACQVSVVGYINAHYARTVKESPTIIFSKAKE